MDQGGGGRELNGNEREAWMTSGVRVQRCWTLRARAGVSSREDAWERALWVRWGANFFPASVSVNPLQQSDFAHRGERRNRVAHPARIMLG
jgi:hypothetical protein